jgi:hypothetical protein
MEPTELVTIVEAAKLLDVHPNTIRRRIKRGVYPTEWASSPNGPLQLIPKSALVANADGPIAPVVPAAFPDRPDHHELTALQATISAYEATIKAKDETIVALTDTIALLRGHTRPWYKRLLGLT